MVTKGKSRKHHERNEEAAEFKVEDRRHWARARADDDDGSGADIEPAPRHPTIVDEYRGRAEEAERKLQEYIAAFKQAQQEQEEFRARLNRDVERRVELGFSELVSDLLESIDDLDLALSHADGVSEAKPLAEGVALARTRFLAALDKRGVQPIEPDGDEFDPEVAEAVSIEPVDSAERDGKVTRTLRPGYRLGDLVIRPARVVVGKAST